VLRGFERLFFVGIFRWQREWDDGTKAMTVGGVGGRFVFVFVLLGWRSAEYDTISGLFGMGVVVFIVS
jgi:hypothetical protein